YNQYPPLDAIQYMRRLYSYCLTNPLNNLPSSSILPKDVLIYPTICAQYSRLKLLRALRGNIFTLVVGNTSKIVCRLWEYISQCMDS
ncbi:MAG: hypothetical protein PHN55_15930, partial [Dysgonamonadaceae bacterium]|nr:hypothetical protein [Dysgonamonadaceae bacterium]